MPRLLLLLVLGYGGYRLLRWLRAAPPGQRRQRTLQVGLAAAAAIVILLAAMGRVHWLGAIAVALLPVLQRLFGLLLRLSPLAIPWLQRRYQRRTSSQKTGHQSEVHSLCLRMLLDHDSQRIQGWVIDGPFSGQELDAMDAATLAELRRYCHTHDPDGLTLLQAYLRYRFGEDDLDDASAHQSDQTSPGHDAALTRSEALAILGLADDADRQQILQAHRRLMQKLHPDRGGSDYLAARINEAKETLLRNAQ